MSTNEAEAPARFDPQNREDIERRIADLEVQLANASKADWARVKSRIRYWNQKLVELDRGPVSEQEALSDPDPSHYAVRRVPGDARWYIGTNDNPRRFGPWATSRDARAFFPFVPWALSNERRVQAA